MTRAGLRPIYEWHWQRPDGTVRRTRSTRSAHAYRLFAERLGGRVTRHSVGFRLPLSLLMDEAIDGPEGAGEGKVTA